MSAHSIHYQVWILAGQSNMVGNFNAGDLSALPADLVNQPDIRYYNGRLSAQWGNLRPLSNNTAPGFTHSFGLELSFGHDLAAANPDARIAIIKYAINSTSLHNNWLGKDTENISGSPGRNCYAILVNTVVEALNALTRDGTFELGGMVWVQAESDADNQKSARDQANKYADNLRVLISKLRSEPQLQAPNLRFIYSRIHDKLPPQRFDFANTVRQQQALVARDYNVYMVNADDIPIQADRVHFTAGGLVTLGSRLAGSTYLPDIKSDGTWVSQIFIRNDGVGFRDVTISFYNDSGAYVGVQAQRVLPNTVWQYTPTRFVGSAIVDGGADVSVVVTRRRFPTASSDAYTGSYGPKTSSAFYLPTLLRQRHTASGLANNQIIVQNTGTSAVNVDVQLLGSSALQPPSSYLKRVTLQPNARFYYDLANEGALPAEWYGSAVVSAREGHKIAVIADTRIGPDELQTLNAFPYENRTTKWYVPNFLSRVSSLTGAISTTLVVQNVSGKTIPTDGIQLRCVKDPASPGPLSMTLSNPAPVANHDSCVFNPVTDSVNFPAGWYGSCSIVSSQEIVAYFQTRLIDPANPARASSSATEAIGANGTHKRVCFPVIQKRLADGSATVVTIQNLSATNPAHVTFQYFASCDGCANVTVGPYEIPAGGRLAHNHRLPGPGSGSGQHNLPDGWFGSLVVHSSDEPIDGYAQLTDISNSAGDTFMSYHAVTRP